MILPSSSIRLALLVDPREWQTVIAVFCATVMFEVLWAMLAITSATQICAQAVWSHGSAIAFRRYCQADAFFPLIFTAMACKSWRPGSMRKRLHSFRFQAQCCEAGSRRCLTMSSFRRFVLLE